MKTFWIVLFFLIGVALPVWSADLTGNRVFDTGARPCFNPNNGQGWWDPWRAGTTDPAALVPPPLVPIYIRALTVMIGVDSGTVADIQVILQRQSDGAWLIYRGWDHYVEPTASAEKEFRFAPDYFLLLPTDTLWLASWCGPTAGKHFRVVVTIQYTLTPP